MAFFPEPPHVHGQVPRTAVLLCNLGTPDEPTPKAVRRYLAEFLWDPRVVEIPAIYLDGSSCTAPSCCAFGPPQVGGQVRQHLDARRARR